MASITHKKVSTIPDGADTDLVLPSDWNNEHSLSLSAADIAHFTGIGLLSSASASALFLTSASAAAAYQPVGDYVDSASLVTALAPYLTSASAALSTYLTSASASALYLTSASAALSTYLTSLSASAKYVSSDSLVTALALKASATLSLAQLSDVSLSATVSDGQFLRFASGKWRNETVAPGGGESTESISAMILTALGPYLTSASAALSTYVTSSSLITALAAYLTSASASAAYLTSASAALSTYVTSSSLATALATYVTSASSLSAHPVKLASKAIPDGTAVGITASFAGVGTFSELRVSVAYMTTSAATPIPRLSLSTEQGASTFLVVNAIRPTPGSISFAAATQYMVDFKVVMTAARVYGCGTGFCTNAALPVAVDTDFPWFENTSTATTGTVVNQVTFSHTVAGTTKSISSGWITVYGIP